MYLDFLTLLKRAQKGPRCELDSGAGNVTICLGIGQPASAEQQGEWAGYLRAKQLKTDHCGGLCIAACKLRGSADGHFKNPTESS